jgi:hypothetical protein
MAVQATVAPEAAPVRRAATGWLGRAWDGPAYLPGPGEDESRGFVFLPGLKIEGPESEVAQPGLPSTPTTPSSA